MFFAVQDPAVKCTKKQEEDPNWKVKVFLKHILRVSKEAWKCGKFISVDEQTIKFQGRHPDKLRITYKNEGGGFQCDALCSNGYTYSFYFPNEPPPEKYTKKGMSPLHACVMSLFDSLEDNAHNCNMDNLYTSANFFAKLTTIQGKSVVMA